MIKMPNDKIFYAIAALAGVCILVAGGYLAGIQTGDAKAVARLNGIVVELQEENARLSAAKTKKENEIAEQVSRANRAEQERINAIKTNSHQSARIKNLQRELDRISNATQGDNSRIIILDLDAFERVREGVRRGGQPEADPASAISSDLSSLETYRYLPDPACLWGRNPQHNEGRWGRISGMPQSI
jgi:hypothetical protein